VTQETKRAFLTDMEQTHGRQLRRFLSARMRGAAADVADLTQEIFLRLLRIENHETIRNPQAYLYTVASHVLHQYSLRRAAAPEKMAPLQVVLELQSAAMAPDPADQLETEQRLEKVSRAL
jgi:DNA-directed RNA polymerase specialized sigma24 family protein